MLLIPCDPLHPRKPDEHFAEEAEAARELGIHVALVDHDALTRHGGSVAAVARVAPTESARDAVYRGWMLRSEQYAEFARALATKGVVLRTSTAQYQRAHELPGWYDALSPLTPESVWTHGPSPTEFRECCRQLRTGPAIVRDYSKSMKHYWHEAFPPAAALRSSPWPCIAPILSSMTMLGPAIVVENDNVATVGSDP
jgi:hypothetical protein